MPADRVFFESVVRSEIESTAKPPDVVFGIVPSRREKEANVGVGSGNVGIAGMDDDGNACGVKGSSGEIWTVGRGGGRQR